jgi:hydroxypyruvate reductase
MTDHRARLLEIYASGLAAVQGEQTVYRAMIARGKREPCHVVAIGKAADAMLRGAQRYLRDHLQSALLITKHGHVTSATQDHVQLIESAHPVPDESSLQAGQALITYLQNLPENAPVLFLISGGASSLVEVLAEGWTLERLQESTQELLANGSPISEINAMRRSLSQIKGGKLWQYLGERPVSCLLMSDVPGDDPAVIGSGLLFPVPRENFDWEIIASNRQALEAMAVEGVTIMPDFLEGNAEAVAHLCIEHLRNSEPGIYLWGAETTVQLPPYPGQGGRNQHLALAAALQLRPDDKIFLLAAGTDGTDGVTADAGALVDNGTIQRGKYENLDPVACLQAADAGTFLDASGDLIHTGPTGTNVMDVIIGLKL